MKYIRSTLFALALSAMLMLPTASASSIYCGLNGSLRLAQGSERQRGGAALLAGAWLTDNFALEGEASLVEELPGLAVRALCNFRAWEEFDLLFGNERLDPFFTFGARGAFRGGNFGPTVGLGARYYLDDHWAIRGDADAMLGLEGDTAMVYTLSLGLEYTF